MTEIQVTLTFTTPPNIGSGAQEGTLADRGFIKARDGWPYVPATVFKGRLRHAVERVARGLGVEVCDTHRKMCRQAELACPVCKVFGSPWITGRLRFVDLELSAPQSLVDRRREKLHPHTQIRYGVATGNLSVGEQLPTVRALAVQLKVNLNTVSKAYRELEIQNILETQQGTGTFIGSLQVQLTDEERQAKLASICTEFLSIAASYGFSIEEMINELRQR